jgi:putative pyruvate formate lyase activating enzyme
VLVGRRGSGTIFFTGCNLACVFCQNYHISQLRHGRSVSGDELAGMMIDLQRQGCYNINLVTPTLQVPRILDALCLAVDNGLTLPLVYNCGGYESVEPLKLLDGIVDIYMPDIKYGHNDPGRTYSGVPDYWDRCREAVIEMHRQVGDLKTGNVPLSDGAVATVATRGLLVRHLVFPRNIARTENVVGFLSEEVSRNTYMNIMAQYKPAYHAQRHPEIDWSITAQEYRQALDWARAAGLHRFAD